MTLAAAPALATLMGQSALRSLLLGAVVLAALKLVRLRDLRAETAVWTAVLAAALAMPLLARVLPGISLRLPAAAHAPALAAGLAYPAAEAHGRWGLPALSLALTAVYVVGVAVGLARLIAGLGLVAMLYRRARPVPEAWARGKAIRASEAVAGPLSFARCILLPADYAAWPQAKLAAVLAHEECHIRRGDFFIQLLASAHRALFWFSPFPWWLQRKLGDLAETASDAAGARRIGDAAGYAEILLDVTRAAQAARRRLAGAPVLAMAHGPALALRVDTLLAAAPERTLGAASRTAALAGVAAAALGLAAVHAALAHDPLPPANAAHAGSVAPSALAAPTGRAAWRASIRTPPPAPSSPRRRPAAAKAPITAAAPADPHAATYDPLALVRDDDVVAALPVILVGPRLAGGAHD